MAIAMTSYVRSRSRTTTRECLVIEVDGSLRGEHVVAALNRLAQHLPLPRYIKADNGSEFISKAIDKWAYENGVEIDFSLPSKPPDNAKNESFVRRFREECIIAHWFLSPKDARRTSTFPHERLSAVVRRRLG
jgi:putative transposase